MYNKKQGQFSPVHHSKETRFREEVVAMPRAAPSSSPLALALAVAVVVALAVSSCSATTDAPGPGAGGMVVRDDPKCEEMVPCTFRRCIQYCVSIGLQPKGFCNWKPNMQVYCCCIIGRSGPPIPS